MKSIAETENYIAVKDNTMSTGMNDWEAAMKHTLKTCEDLRKQGFRPLHYIPRLNVWVCEKH